ncbi:MAG TPA: TetR/AcrR family transcriptional regulator [Burkholderiaceae bacterium]
MARTTGSDGTRTEEAIRAAAVALIAARGYEAMTLRQLAQKVGVQPGTIYRYFPGKSKLLVALLVEHLEFLLARWEDERPRGADALGRLRAFVDFHVRFHTLRRQEAFVANMELRSLSSAERRKVVALRRRYEDILAAILAEGGADGSFEIAEPRIAAFAILAMLTGVGAWYQEGGRLGQRELIDLYTRMVMRCVGARAPSASAASAARERAAHARALAG